MRTLLSAIAIGLLLVSAAIAAPKDKGGGKGKHNHHSGQKLLGDKIKKNGAHQLDRKGKHTVTAEVKDGKIAGVKVKHDTKGDVPVTKYKSKKKMASVEGAPSEAVPADEYVGTVWIGYGYVDEDGNEEIYWFPYDMILDGDTGAIDYVPA
ncbi:MAG TPA: hypothetical protein VFT22_19490 [Kofleriaceae bacterium]|nr:hypothetical protein [Kofleriaceae bacterium]